MDEHEKRIKEIISQLKKRQKDTIKKLRKNIGSMHKSNSFLGPQTSMFEAYFSNLVAQLEQQLGNITETMHQELMNSSATITDESIAKVNQLSNDPNMPDEIKTIFTQLETLMRERQAKGE